MNKQELIEKWKLKLRDFDDCLSTSFQEGQMWEIEGILTDLEELDEPEKPDLPVIPKEVADMIEYHKGLVNSIDILFFPHLWIVGNTKTRRFVNRNKELVARAWLDGYEIEKEKKYTARLKIINDDVLSYLNFRHKDGVYLVSSSNNNPRFRTHFTKEELEDINVWNSDQWEIEEVDYE